MLGKNDKVRKASHAGSWYSNDSFAKLI